MRATLIARSPGRRGRGASRRSCTPSASTIPEGGPRTTTTRGSTPAGGAVVGRGGAVSSARCVASSVWTPGPAAHDSAVAVRPTRPTRAARRVIRALPPARRACVAALVGVAAEVDRGEVGDADVGQGGDPVADLGGRADDGDVGRSGRALAVEHRPVARELAVDDERPWRPARGRRRGRSVTHTGRAAITRGLGRPAASAAAVIVGIVWPASVAGPVHHVSVPSASSAAALSICGPRAATTIGNGVAPARRHRGVHPVVLAVEGDRLTPRQRAEHGQVLAEVAHRLGEAHPHHRLDDDLVAQADAEAQSPAGWPRSSSGPAGRAPSGGAGRSARRSCRARCAAPRARRRRAR